MTQGVALRPGPPRTPDLRPRTGFRTDLQGLRAVAVLAVVLYHAGVPHLPGGYVGVDVFFVLSGFLITGLLWRELAGSGRVRLAAFYGRRARRLLPAAVLVLVATVLTAALRQPPLTASATATDAVAAALYGLNYRLAVTGTDYLSATAPPSPLQHYWSLGVEEQFYLVWPLLLLFAVAAGRRVRRGATPSRAAAGLALAVLGAGSLALSLELTRRSQPWAFYSLPTRAWELAVGGLLALGAPLVRRVPAALAAPLGGAGLATVLWAVTRLGASTPYPGTAALLPVGGTVALLAAGSVPARYGPGRLLARRPLQHLGAVSYSWYLWHWPLLVLLPGPGAGLPARLGPVLLGLVLAELTTRWYEAPLRAARALRPAGRSLALGAALTALAVLAASGLGVQSRDRVGGQLAAPAAAPSPALPAPARSAPSAPASPSGPEAGLRAAQAAVAAAVAQGVATRAVPANLSPALPAARRDVQVPFADGCDLGFTQSVPHPCTFGATGSPTRVVALGDSHAAQWFPALDATARRQGWQLENLTKATCPPLALPIYSPVLHRAFTECDRFRALALARVQAEHPALVVLDMARHYGPEYRFTVYGGPWLAALHDLVAQLRAGGSQVLVLGPTPKPRGDLPTCLSAHLSDVPACTGALSDEVDAAGAQAERAATTSAGGSYADVAPWLCTSTTCAAVVGNLLVLRDDNHLTDAYATWLTPVVATVVMAAAQGPLPAYEDPAPATAGPPPSG